LIYFLTKNTLKNNHYHHSFETRPGPTGRPRTRDWNRAELKKKREKKKPGVTWLTRRVDLARPGQDPVANPLTFVFFLFLFLLKRRRFDFFKKKKLTWPTWWPGQNPEPGPWTGPATGPGHILKYLFKNKHKCETACKRMKIQWRTWNSCVQMVSKSIIKTYILTRI